MGLQYTAAATLLTVVGFVVQNLSVVYWTAAPISQYGVLAFCNLFFPLVFGAALLAFAAYKRDWNIMRVADDPDEASYFRLGSAAQISAASGLANALNGVLIVYASPPDHTPPLVQTVLQNCGILFVVPASKLFLGDLKNYAAWQPLLAFALIAASVTLSVLPTILAGVGGSVNGITSVEWSLLYALGTAPGAVLNVLQQRYLMQLNTLRKDVSNEEVTIASLRCLFWGNAWQTLFMASLFWTDLLPWFGTSSSMAQFGDRLVYSLTCSFAGPGGAVAGALAGAAPSDCQNTIPGWAYGFMLGYVASYIGGVMLNRESSTYQQVVFVFVSILTVAVWLIPGVNPSPTNTPLWSVLPAVALSLAGMTVWKRWEGVADAHENYDMSAFVRTPGGKHLVPVGGTDEQKIPFLSLNSDAPLGGHIGAYP